MLRRENKLVIDHPVVWAANHRAGVDHDELVVLDSLVDLAVAALPHGNLHEETGEQCPADICVVVLVGERCADQLDIMSLHDTTELGTNVVCAGKMTE